MLFMLVIIHEDCSPYMTDLQGSPFLTSPQEKCGAHEISYTIATVSISPRLHYNKLS